MTSLIPKAQAPLPLDDFAGWLASFTQTSALFELSALSVCVLLAWALVTGLRSRLGSHDPRSILFGRRGVDGVLFPLLLLCLGYAARAIADHYIPLAFFRIAIPVLVSLVAIRVGVKVLQAAFVDARWARAMEQTISWVAWIGVVLWVSGLAPVILNELDQITWKVGNSTISVRTMLEGLLTAGAVLLVTLWISAAIEARLLRQATGSQLSLRLAISNATRALLMFIGLIVALSSVGIDLTALGVLGGAVGVGIGLGLQKLAANYVSGFVILTERALRIGDTVRVDGFDGVITQINMRYTVVRSQGGRESIVPNELLVINRVENLSLQDSRVNQTTTVSVAYDADVDLVRRLLVEAALAQEKVVKDPAPSAQLTAFGADGLEFTLAYWMADPNSNPRSDINLAILAALRAHKIEIPYPQRVVHQA